MPNLSNFFQKTTCGLFFLYKNQGKDKYTALYTRDHPFKTSAFLMGGGVKNLPNLPTDSSKNLATVGG